MTEPVPDEYESTVASGVEKLSQGAEMVMFVAEMLGNDIFELETAEGYKIVITKSSNSEPVLVT